VLLYKTSYVLRDNVFTQYIPKLHRSVTFVYGKYYKNVCLKAYIWYPNDCLARIIVYIWPNIDILCIETVLYYYDFLVYTYNMHPD